MTYNTIADIQRFTRKYTEAVYQLKPTGMMGRLVKRLLVGSHSYAVSITHVDTSALKNSHIMELDLTAKEAFGSISISRRTRNPLHGEPPYIYGVEEHDRGGPHAFYERTFKEKTLADARKLLKDLADGFDAELRG